MPLTSSTACAHAAIAWRQSSLPTSGRQVRASVWRSVLLAACCTATLWQTPADTAIAQEGPRERVLPEPQSESESKFEPQFETPFQARTEAPSQAAERGRWGVETRFIDTHRTPGSDFYQYVNDGWLKTASLPQGFASNGVFLELQLKTEAQVEAIIQDAANRPEQTGPSPEGLIAAMYQSYLDTDSIKQLGLAPVAPGLARIEALADHTDAARVMAMPMHASVVGLGVMLDPGNPERYVLSTSQAGLGLPGKDYYLRDDAPFPAHRAAYLDYITETLARAGLSAPRARAEAVLAFESQLAERHWTPSERRDRVRNYNLMPVSDLKTYAGGFPWQAFMDELGVGDAQEIVVGTDSAVAATATLYAQTDLDTLRDYMAFHFLDRHAPLMNEDWVAAHFDFHSRRLNGIAEDRPRATKAIQFVNQFLGEPVGRTYVTRHFPPEHLAQMQELVGYLRTAFRERLAELDWMDADTRSAALEKLEAFTPKIGYPERWHDYSELDLRADDLVGNVVRFHEWAWEDERAKLSEPRRDWEWGMTPQTVNAYYSPTRNEIVFPAAILQGPFFDPAADPAVNFAAIGGVIGHEMGHGFDDQGSRADANGTLRNWWSERSRDAFDALAAQLVDQYAQFSPIPGMHVDGALTLGENIGDLGGLNIAYAAWKRFEADHYPDGHAPILDGYTGDQRFFLSWAQVWRTLQTDDAARRQILTDPHSPAQYRVNGVVRNMTPWYEAFEIDEDAPLYLAPEARISIW